MLCEECGRNEANIHIVKNVGGKQTELNLCEKCARNKEELDFTLEPQFSLHKLFASMLSQTLKNKREATAASGLQCPTCGLTFAQFGQIGRLGCSDCLQAFEENLKPLLRRIHGGCRHSGKIPLRLQGRVKAIREIEQLKEKLQLSIENEEFEEAAILRDRIRFLEERVQRENGDQVTDNLEERDSGNKAAGENDNHHQDEEGEDR